MTIELLPWMIVPAFQALLVAYLCVRCAIDGTLDGGTLGLLFVGLIAWAAPVLIAVGLVK